MGRLRTAYLREMGIDVWVLRENVAADGVALSRLSVNAPIHAKVRPQGSAAATDAIVVAPQIRRASVPSLSPASVSMPPLPVRSGAVKKAVPADARPSNQVVADPEFLLCLLDFSRDERELSCLFFLSYRAKGLPPAINRFAADLAIACLGGPSEPRRTDLRWPMVKSSHIAQSADDARQVVVSKVKNCGRDVLVFGPSALSYCGIEPSVAADATAGVAAHGKRLWPLAEVDHYCNDDPAQAKISLWRTLVAIRAHGE